MTTNDLRTALLELTPGQQIAAETVASGATHAAAAEAAGVHRETVTRWAGHHPAFRATLNLYRATLAAEQSDTARRIRGRALAILEAQLDTADVPTALAVLRVVQAQPSEAIGPIEAAAILDAETNRTRVNLPPLPTPRGLQGQLARLDGPARPSAPTV